MRRLGSFFLRLLKTLLVRNLASVDANLSRLPTTRLQISSSPEEGDEEIMFEGDEVCGSCNPSWSLQKMVSGGDKQDVVEKHYRDQSLVIRIVSARDGKVLYHQAVIFKQLLFMGRIELHHFSHLPLNALFFQSDEGLWVLDDQYTVLHRYLSVSASEALLSTRLGDVEEETKDADDKDGENGEEGKKSSGAGTAQSEADELLSKLRNQVSARSLSTRAGGGSQGKNPRQKEELEKLRKRTAKMEAEADAEERYAENDARALASYRDLEKSLLLCDKLASAVKASEAELRALLNEGIRSKFLLDTRQLVLVGDLQALYPIEQLASGRYCIRGIEMPPLDCPQKDEETLCTALGCVVHLLCLLSKYLGTPLRYQMLYFSSRSMMRDAVAGVSAPLYRKDIEIFRFRRAIVWLRRNIEQLLGLRGLKFDHNCHLLAEVRRVVTDVLVGVPTDTST